MDSTGLVSHCGKEGKQKEYPDSAHNRQILDLWIPQDSLVTVVKKASRRSTLWQDRTPRANCKKKSRSPDRKVKQLLYVITR